MSNPFEGWKFERVLDDHIRIVDPQSPIYWVICKTDPSPMSRMLYRLAEAHIEAAEAAKSKLKERTWKM